MILTQDKLVKSNSLANCGQFHPQLHPHLVPHLVPCFVLPLLCLHSNGCTHCSENGSILIFKISSSSSTIICCCRLHHLGSDFACSGGGFSLSSSGGLGGLFHDACTSSSSPCHCTNSSENGLIFKSNMSSSSTILHHLGLDPSG